MLTDRVSSYITVNLVFDQPEAGEGRQLVLTGPVKSLRKGVPSSGTL